MEEPKAGQVYHTKDGKTVYLDPKTQQASIFEGILTIDKIIEPPVPEIQELTADEIKDLMQELLFPGLLSFDVFMVGGKGGQIETEPADLLGPKNYYILIPEKAPALSHPCLTSAWVSEFQKGHHPDYKDYRKHRILPEQWNWLNNHKKCSSVIAWTTPECPAFVALACQDHAKIIRPVSIEDKIIPTLEALPEGFAMGTGTVHTVTESVLTEEREV